MHKSASPDIGRTSDAARLGRGVIYQVLASAALLAVVLASWPGAPALPLSRAAHRPIAPTVQPLEEKFTPPPVPRTPSARIDWM
jgi:hypothetical protein